MSQATYTFDDVMNCTKSYFNGGELEAAVWADKYAMKDNGGKFYELTPHDMHNRLAAEFARIDVEKYGYSDLKGLREKYLDAMAFFERIVPQGSPMTAVGNYLRPMSASNCVVVESPQDSIGGIFKTGTELAQLYKRRCGVGVDVSTLRPDGFFVNNAARTTTGPVSFCDFYSYITRLIGQDGRRGALMLTMDVHHPDVEKFATMKADKKKVTGANVSVRLSDEFLIAVANDEEYEQRWPCEGTPQFTRKVKARQVWDTIIKNATFTAEPGLIFWDRMTRRLPAHSYAEFRSRSTNPCSEICLSAYDSCRLISINLLGFVRNAFKKDAKFDFDKFASDVRLAVRMADNLVDIELELIDKIIAKTDDIVEKEMWGKLRKAGERGRRVGLGTHGLADCMAQLGIKYDSREALAFADKLYELFRNTAYRESIDLAKVRGPFPAFDWNVEKDNEYIKDLPADIRAEMAVYGRRNIALLTQAPTGSVSLVSKGGTFNRFNISSGVEPMFKRFYIRRKKGNPGDHGFRTDRIDELGDHWMEFKVYHNNILNWQEVTGGDLNNLPDIFVEAEEIDWKFRVELQGVEQKYIDHSISSTINLPRGTGPDVVGQIYLHAWKSGLKGITVYVDGSRDGVLVDVSEGADKKKVDTTKRPEKVVRMMAPKRPKELRCEIHHHTVKGRKWTAIVGLMDGEPYELFGGYADTLEIPVKCKTGKIVRKSQGKYNLVFDNDCEPVEDIVSKMGCGEFGWATRLISTSLRHGTPIEFIVEQLAKDGGLTDLNKVLARVLKKYIGENKKMLSSNKCPSCDGTEFIYQEGCPRCQNCGWTKCS
jgi:ribonucleoside-diphosphate reductase alpha chain